MSKKQASNLAIYLVAIGIALIILTYIESLNVLTNLNTCSMYYASNCNNIHSYVMITKVAPYVIVFGLILVLSGIMLMFNNIDTKHTKKKS